MTITELYNKLDDKDFQNHLTGNLFFPAYMYVYDPDKEYEIDQEIMNIKERLHRPTNYLDVMVLDIFEEFLEFLRTQNFGKVSKYEYFLKQEESRPEQVEKSLRQAANDDRFYTWLDKKIRDHFHQAGDAEVAYVFVKGFGAIFPYMRASKFMNNFEKHISGYKLIIFYPGEVSENYNLFKVLNDENLYRAIKLIN
ncbi:MAG: DUF1788 domain-containing protein [Bacteroidetes bacterium]|nr:DUF1788 domain-containing protein [Saprospiraceae bacterium]MCB0821003.1 DUF1788 domain-containing protein [Bacteroidota bacterium]MCB9342815.1 DUF1788 domain-containing protein [Lewinellaceae bacterium]